MTKLDKDTAPEIITIAIRSIWTCHRVVCENLKRKKIQITPEMRQIKNSVITA
jgi:hypothetical protein